MMGRRNKHISEEIGLLPHWARVAYAARCARIVLPLFHRYWPEGVGVYPGGIEKAIALTEQSAAEMAAAPGLDQSGTEATKTAGAALARLYPRLKSLHPLPPDDHSAIVVHQVALAAERATKVARASVDQSANAALEAYTFAREAAHAAEDAEMLDPLHEEFASLYRVAMRGKWSDSTPVPPSVFGLLAEERPRKAWWQIWRTDA